VVDKGKTAMLTPRAGEHEYLAPIKERAAQGRSLQAISAWLKTEGIELSHMGVKTVLSRAD
jgi:hypothetical protein